MPAEDNALSAAQQHHDSTTATHPASSCRRPSWHATHPCFVVKRVKCQGGLRALNCLCGAHCHSKVIHPNLLVAGADAVCRVNTKPAGAHRTGNRNSVSHVSRYGGQRGPMWRPGARAIGSRWWLCAAVPLPLAWPATATGRMLRRRDRVRPWRLRRPRLTLAS